MTNTNKNLSTWLGNLKHFTIHASIDGIEERNTYIRFPCDWNSVIKSIEFYKQTMLTHKNGNFSFAPAIQLLNVDQLDDLINFFIANFVTKNCNVAWVSQVRYPIICDYSIVPIDYRQKIAEKLFKSAEKIQIEKIKNSLKAHAVDLTVEVYNEDQKKNYQKMFIKYNDIQDKFRGKKTWRELIPELEKSLTHSTK